MGRDVYSQFVWGARSSLAVGFATGLLITALGTVIGLVAGYFGGRTDATLDLLTNAVLVIPNIPLLILLASFAGTVGPLAIMAIIALTSWPWGARMTRAQTLALRNREFVVAARMVGEPSWRIIFVEILPNLVPLIGINIVGIDHLRHRRADDARISRFRRSAQRHLGHHALQRAELLGDHRRRLVGYQRAGGRHRASSGWGWRCSTSPSTRSPIRNCARVRRSAAGCASTGAACASWRPHGERARCWKSATSASTTSCDKGAFRAVKNVSLRHRPRRAVRPCRRIRLRQEHHRLRHHPARQAAGLGGRRRDPARRPGPAEAARGGAAEGALARASAWCSRAR